MPAQNRILSRQGAALIDSTALVYSGIQVNMTLPLETAAEMLQELLRLITPKCASELVKYREEYTGAGIRIKTTAQNVKTLVERKKKQLDFDYLEYRAGNESLHKVAVSVAFDTMLAQVSFTVVHVVSWNLLIVAV